MQLTASIFKAYDIRGIVPSTINEDVAEALGKAFGTTALAQGEKTVAVGRDGRLSGPGLAAALVRGLAASGIDVIDIGMATTPMLYFAANTLCHSGIQVTGSHNPKDYNGFKMVLAGDAIEADQGGLGAPLRVPTDSVAASAARRRPPLRPRVAQTQPARARWPTTFTRWLTGRSNWAAISATVTGARRSPARAR